MLFGVVVVVILPFPLGIMKSLLGDRCVWKRIYED